MPNKDASAMDESKWNPARLIPTSGLARQQEQENRATSVLLAVMHAVPEFGSSLLSYGQMATNRTNMPRVFFMTTFSELSHTCNVGREAHDRFFCQVGFG